MPEKPTGPVAEFRIPEPFSSDPSHYREMAGLLDRARLDYITNKKTPYIISRDLIDAFHRIKGHLLPDDRPAFEVWFRKEHDALGKKIQEWELEK